MAISEFNSRYKTSPISGMSKNYLAQSSWLLLLVITLLFLVSFLPAISIGDIEIKKIDLLADLYLNPAQPPDSSIELIAIDTVKKDSVILIKEPANPVVAFPCPPGITCLEDFSPGKKTLKPFFTALNQRKSTPVRIAFYGDSFIEGDIISESLRDTLQEIYGGTGVGLVPLASEVSQYRLSIHHAFDAWSTYSLVGKRDSTIPLGISGYAFVPEAGNSITYRPGRGKFPKQFYKAKLFYTSRATANLRVLMNDSIEQYFELAQTDSLKILTIEAEKIKIMKLQFTAADSLIGYGISFEKEGGVYVDNFGMRGNSGMALGELPENLLLQFDQIMNYKLILLQYGLNMVTEKDSTDYAWYQNRMIKVVNRYKQLFPDASIVMVSISDRAYNANGTFKTIPAINRMRAAQRNIAKRSQVAYWDLFEAMGGENSIVNYVTAIPPLAAKDYTHLTFRGGEKIAKKLADALLYEQHRYDKKNPVP